MEPAVKEGKRRVPCPERLCAEDLGDDAGSLQFATYCFGRSATPAPTIPACAAHPVLCPLYDGDIALPAASFSCALHMPSCADIFFRVQTCPCRCQVWCIKKTNFYQLLCVERVWCVCGVWVLVGLVLKSAA